MFPTTFSDTFLNSEVPVELNAFIIILLFRLSSEESFLFKSGEMFLLDFWLLLLPVGDRIIDLLRGEMFAATVFRGETPPPLAFD